MLCLHAIMNEMSNEIVRRKIICQITRPVLILSDYVINQLYVSQIGIAFHINSYK